MLSDKATVLVHHSIKHFTQSHSILAGMIHYFNKSGTNFYRSKGDTHILSNGKTAPDSHRWLCLDFISSPDIGSTPIANVQETKKQNEETLDDRNR